MQSIRQEQKDDLSYDQRSELPNFQVILKSSANQNHIRKLDVRCKHIFILLDQLTF
jgi:hypothetical protein